MMKTMPAGPVTQGKKASAHECVNGVEICVRNVEPAEDVCDRVDNDCDGQVDGSVGDDPAGDPGPDGDEDGDGIRNECDNDLCAENGCVIAEGGCWCVTGGGSGRAKCGHVNGYAGPYYSLTGTWSADGCAGNCPAAGGNVDGDRARRIIAALGMQPHPSHCGAGSQCNADCATNIDSARGIWGTSLSCWNNVDRWNRTGGIVRCVPFE